MEYIIEETIKNDRKIIGKFDNYDDALKAGNEAFKNPDRKGTISMISGYSKEGNTTRYKLHKTWF